MPVDKLVKLSVDAPIRRPETQPYVAVQQSRQVQGQVAEHQFHLENKRFADGFTAREGHDGKSFGQTGYLQTK